MSDLPETMRSLKKDEHGRPIPWFVPIVNGEPDFRLADSDKIMLALRFRTCWICGLSLPARRVAFVLGPMGAINHMSPEPPSHKECAIYAARRCPFLSNPLKKRRAVHMPDEATRSPHGVDINPGCACVALVSAWRAERHDGHIFHFFREPFSLLWYREGREATHEEVLAALARVKPEMDMLAERDGPDGIAAFGEMYQKAVNAEHRRAWSIKHGAS